MDYLIHLAILIAIYSILGLSLNLIVGYTGLFSIAHAAFYGIGAYSTALLLTRFEVNFFLSMLIGIMITLIISLLAGIVLSRFSEDYYAIVSIGFAVIGFAVFLNWVWLTNGPVGIPGIDKPAVSNFVFSSNLSFLGLTLFFLGIIFLICRFIVNSSFGRVLKAIREDEKAIEVFGYNTTYYKLIIFVIGALMTSIAGSLFGSYLSFVGPSMFMLRESIFILVIIILGGLGNLYGSILGALFLILLPEALRFVGLPGNIAAQMRQVIYGVKLILLMLYRPQGFIGEYKL
ncbi:MAG TPA: branched-chain amino acid ABC transporter permease [Nitrospirae bacterium]|nr:branched-chain amino acid ABC transporter permease [Nitrospirota bacterium]HDZ03388.1 branched-chain amino acid ABC transporter permease [Nitrospirota bacterium]